MSGVRGCVGGGGITGVKSFSTTLLCIPCFLVLNCAALLMLLFQWALEGAFSDGL